MALNDPERPRLGEVLVAAGAVNDSELKAALAEQSRSDTPLGMTLVRMGVLDEATLVRALAGQLNLPVVSLRGKRINREILDLVPLATAEKYRCLPLLLNNDGGKPVLYLGFEDPTDTAAFAEISTHIGMAIQPVLVSPTELDECIHRHYHWESSGAGEVDAALHSGPLGMRKSSDEPVERKSLAAPSGLFAESEGLDDGDEVGFGEFIDPDLGIEEAADLDGNSGREFEPEFEMESSDELSPPDSPVAPEPELPEPEIPEVLEFAEPRPAVIPAKPAVTTNTNDSMLRAIAQLLIEKGVFSREELVDRLRIVAKEEA